MITLRHVAALTALGLAAAPLAAQHLPGHVLDHRFVSEGAGGFTGMLADGDAFGRSICSVGDLDGDGIAEIAVGAPETDGAGSSAGEGRVWILFPDAAGTIVHAQRLDDTHGDLPFALAAGDRFGSAVEPAGDLNGDGVPDLWVGARGNDTGAAPHAFQGPGAVYALLLESDGTVMGSVKLSAASGLALSSKAGFGTSIASVGDLDGNGVPDLVVGAPFTDGSEVNQGAIWLLLLDTDGSLVDSREFSGATSLAIASLPMNANFGWSVEALGDIDHNDTPDFVVGCPQDTVNEQDDGSIWFARTAGGLNLSSLARFASDASVFGGDGPDAFSYFGRSLARVGDIDGDGADDLAVGSPTDGLLSEGTVWILRLGGPTAAFVRSATRLDGDEGFVPLALEGFDLFGFGLSPAGDLDGDGTPDLLVGIPGDDTGGDGAGAFAMLALRGPTFVDLGGGVGPGPTPSLGAEGTLVGGEDFTVQLKNGPSFGAATAVLGFSEIHAPLKGGVMVPAPDLLLSSFPLNGIGFLSVTAPWSMGIPLGAEVTLQLWMPDASAPAGFSGSNAIRFIAGA